MKMMKRISTTVSEELAAIAKQYGINWAEALRVGIVILAASYGYSQYQNALNKSRVKALAEMFGYEVKEATTPTSTETTESETAADLNTQID